MRSAAASGRSGRPKTPFDKSGWAGLSLLDDLLVFELFYLFW